MSKTQISLENFFIFNSTLCPKEGEEEKKILFFHPEIDDKNEKLKNIGYIEAIIQFTGNFSLDPTTNRDVMTMKTTKFTKLFFEPEKDFWMVLTLKNPKEQKTKDNREYSEYYTDDVHTEIFSKILQRCYLHFRTFCNTFEHNMAGNDVDILKNKLDNFFMKYLLTLNLKNCDILDVIQCIQYKPVTHSTFFRIVNFINMLVSMKNLRIKKCIFLYNQEVVYSSISPTDLFIINEYMVESLFPKFFRLRSNQGLDFVGGCFMKHTENEDETPQSAPRVYLYGDGNRKFECETYRMAFYNIMDVTLVMLIEDAEEALNDEFCNDIKHLIGPQLALISKEIADNISHLQQNVSKNHVEDSSQKNFIYCNHRNHRFHACFNDTNNDGAVSSSSREGKKHNTQLSLSVMNLLCDLYGQDTTDEIIDTERETIIKTYNDYWIVKKCFNFRSLYLILHKNSTLIDISEESQRLLSEIVKNVYFTN